MALSIVADTLYFTNSSSYIQVYNTETLAYEEIDSIVSGAHATLSGDKMGITVTPVSQEGALTYVVLLTSGKEVNIPLFFQSDYYKQDAFNNSYQNYTPSGMLRFYEDDPDTALFQSTEDLFNELYIKNNLIPLTDEFNITFPEYCSNQLVGIGISLVYEQYQRGNSAVEWVALYTVPWGSKDDFDTFIFKGDNPSELDPSTGKYKSIEYGGKVLKLKNGANAQGEYCGAGRALYIQVVTNANPAPGEELLTNWQDTQGVPVTSELIYDTSLWEFDEADYNVVKIPSLSRFQIGEYRPDKWINSLTTEFGFNVLFRFDGTDFEVASLKEAGVFTFDTTNITESFDIGVWS